MKKNHEHKSHHKYAHLRVTLLGQSNVAYVVENDNYVLPVKDQLTGLADWLCYWWSTGDGNCDCNRSQLIHQMDRSFKELPCGHTIALIKLEVVFVYRVPPQYLPGVGWIGAVR